MYEPKSADKSPFQLLRDMVTETGIRKPHLIAGRDIILDVRWTDTMAVVKYRHLTIRETAVEERIEAAEIVALMWTRDAEPNDLGVYGWECNQMRFEDPTFEVAVVKRFDAPRPHEVADKREWERLCYRPGTSRAPLDGPDHVNRADNGERLAAHLKSKKSGQS